MNALDGKQVLIIDAASGIGRAAALLLAQEGRRWQLADREVRKGSAN